MCTRARMCNSTLGAILASRERSTSEFRHSKDVRSIVLEFDWKNQGSEFSLFNL